MAFNKRSINKALLFSYLPGGRARKALIHPPPPPFTHLTLVSWQGRKPILAHTPIYLHILPYTYIYLHIRPYSCIYLHTPAFTVIYPHIPPYTYKYPILRIWGPTWDSKIVISQAPGRFQKWEFDTMRLSMFPWTSRIQKESKIIEIKDFEGSKAPPGASI